VKYECGHPDFDLLNYLHGEVPMVLLEEYEKFLNTEDRKICFICYMKKWIDMQKNLRQELISPPGV
jgi:uncharacterized FlgJ-related protein